MHLDLWLTGKIMHPYAVLCLLCELKVMLEESRHLLASTALTHPVSDVLSVMGSRGYMSCHQLCLNVGA
jgi:hypothetical protein